MGSGRRGGCRMWGVRCAEPCAPPPPHMHAHASCPYMPILCPCGSRVVLARWSLSKSSNNLLKSPMPGDSPARVFSSSLDPRVGSRRPGGLCPHMFVGALLSGRIGRVVQEVLPSRSRYAPALGLNLARFWPFFCALRTDLRGQVHNLVAAAHCRTRRESARAQTRCSFDYSRLRLPAGA
jgi:hypothetical protein